ncbi:reverse transcriptase domain, reverse transcriptase zinc-binding domain protein, partial [Tanacetum coccineum]
NGRDVSFWLDRWIEDFRLCDRFPRLFNLDRRPEGRVAEKGRWVEGVWMWEYEWDIWRWKFTEDGGFAVKELTRLVEERTLDVENMGEDTSWINLVPKKVNIFMWRALKMRLPVREELDKRGIDLDMVLCPCCDSVVESCGHSLVMCSMAMGVWEKVHSWWKLGGVNTFSIRDIFLLNGGVNLTNHSGYFIRKERNNCLFRAKVSSVNKIVQEIQLKSFEWITRRSKKKVIDWHMWLQDPQKCCQIS